MLPVRTSSGKVVKEREYNELLKKGVRPEDAMNIILGKKSRNWSHRMTYMSPSVYIGPSVQNEGIMKQLREPGIRHPQITSRTIYLTGQNNKKSVKNNPNVEINDPIEFLKNRNSVSVMQNKLESYFDLDAIEEEINNIDFVPAKK